MIKAKAWNGKALKGEWHVTIKIDGVRCLWNGKEWLSRADKPLYNLPPFDGRKDCEAYCGGFKETITRIRAKTKDRPIRPDQLFNLEQLDPRLDWGKVEDPSETDIRKLLKRALDFEYEGLVLRQGDKWIKVKPHETYDVHVTDIIAGTGKHEGRMGALVTPMGDVGTGFDDAERQDWWDRRFELSRGDTVIEVECMKLTDDGMFRHPRFLRTRPDKKA